MPETSIFDLAIIGAGPAGMAAAAEARAHGLGVVVLDEQPEPGGQIWRAIERVAAERPADLDVLGASYREGLATVAAFRACGADYRPNTSVWRVDAAEGGVTLAFSRDGTGEIVRARHLLVAAGALERPVPIPGWTLPGVFTAGGAQSVLKGSGMVPAGKVVVAGSGPLIFLVAAQMLAAGADLAGVVVTTTWRESLAALPFFATAWPGRADLGQGLRWRRALAAAGVPYLNGCSDLAVSGTSAADGIMFTEEDRRQTIEADVVLLHDGVVPQTQITRQIGCTQQWEPVQRCWRPEADDWGRTDRPGVSVAGDAGGIAGAKAAVLTGQLAALDIVCRLGRIDRAVRNTLAAPVREALARARAIRPLLDALFPPGPQARRPNDAALICRCEAVTAGELRNVAQLGAVGPNQAKAFTRCGMGACQGRLCALTVSEVIAETRGRAVEDVGVYRVRPPIKPVTLGEIAALDLSDA